MTEIKRYDGAIAELNGQIETIDADIEVMESTVKTLKEERKGVLAALKTLKKLNGTDAETPDVNKIVEEETKSDAATEGKPKK